MNQSCWLILVLVATVACNGNCRPREVDESNTYPVFRSVKQLKLETQNRYEKPFKVRSNDDSVMYERIDVPYKKVNDIKALEKLTLKNNSKTIIDYVPVALTVKKTNVKKWPSDQNGIETPDDLSLYNIYTNNINSLSPDQATTPGHHVDYPHVPHSKPSILILEELTTKRPFYEHPDSVFSKPLQIYNRPLPPSPPPTVYYSTHPPIQEPIFTTELFPVNQVLISNDNYHSPEPIPWNYIPQAQNPPPVMVETPLRPTPPYFEVTTHFGTKKKKKKTKCPNVSIIATNTINNGLNMNKEGCQDITIHIETNINNTNTESTKPSTVGNNSVVPVQNEPTTQTGIFGFFDALWSIISKFFSYTFFNPLFTAAIAPFSAFLAGSVSLSGLVLPWIFPHMLWGGRTSSNTPTLFKIKFEPKPEDQSVSDVLRSDESSTQEVGPNANIPQNVKLNIEAIATVARASSDGPSLPSSAVMGQTADSIGQMVDSDIRTPPKLKEIMKEKTTENRKGISNDVSTPLPYTFVYDEEFGKPAESTEKNLSVGSSEGKASQINLKMTTNEGVKGIAIPVLMDDMDYEPTAPTKKLQKIPEVPKPGKEEKKKNGVTKLHAATTPSSGLSTWILLSDNRDVTTPFPKKSSNKKESNEEKKKVAGVTPTTKKPIKIQTTTLKSSTTSSKKATIKPLNGGGKKPESETNTMSALEAMVKSQKKNFTSTSRPKVEDSSSDVQKKQTDIKKKNTDKSEAAETKNKPESELTIYTLPTNLPMITEYKTPSTTTSSASNEQATTENSVEGTTKKKSSTKKKKKNKNKRRKTSNDTEVESKIPPQPMGSQIYNFLSREIVPTVGLGLIGVALTAGLASFLGYNPFGSSTVPLRRTYDTNHGYSSNNYYGYNSDYGDGGQSEEVLFREVLSGMPEESRYGLTHTDSDYSEAYKRQDQSYDSVKNPTYSSMSGSQYNSKKDMGIYKPTYSQDYSSAYGTAYASQDKNYSLDDKEKYPVYSSDTGTSFVYPETTGMTSADKTSNNEFSGQSSADKYSKTKPDTIERQPEALYRVAGESEYHYRNGESTIQGVTSKNSWHRIGSPADAVKIFPHLEPGPRSLDLTKASAETDKKKRVRRDTESVIQKISPKRTKKANDVENEIDFEDSPSDDKVTEQSSLDLSTTSPATNTKPFQTETTTLTGVQKEAQKSSTPISLSAEEEKDATTLRPTESYEADIDSSPTAGPSGVSVMDVLKRLAQFKLRLGLNFLRSTTDLFSRYLDDIQRRVDESFTNTTTTTVQYNRRNPWSRIFFSRLGDYRKRRSALEENKLLTAMLAENDQFSKVTKKDLRPNDKIFHQKKITLKKYKYNQQ